MVRKISSIIFMGVFGNLAKSSGWLSKKFTRKRMMFTTRAMKTKPIAGLAGARFGNTLPGWGNTLLTWSSSPSDCWTVYRYSHSKIVRALMFAAALMTSHIGFVPVFAEDPPKKTDEPWTAPVRAARKESPIVADAKSLAQGKELFVMGCTPCHGPAGKGDGPVAATLERNGTQIRPGNLSDPKLWQQSDGTLFWKISEGRTPMPAFQEGFSEEQRWQIVTYVRTLAPKEQNKKQ